MSFTQQQLDAGEAVYNDRNEAAFALTEAPGISVFVKDSTGQLFHTYSSFGRGLEGFPGINRFLDIVSKGRAETELPHFQWPGCVPKTATKTPSDESYFSLAMQISCSCRSAPLPYPTRRNSLPLLTAGLA